MTDPKPIGRILEIAPEAMSKTQRAAVAKLVSGPRGRLPTPYKIWLHSPGMVDGMERLGTFLRHNASLSTREQEIAIIVIARHWGADYVLRAHIREAVEAEIPAATAEAIAAGEAVTLDQPREQAVLTVTTAFCNGTLASDDLFGLAETTLGRAGIAELLGLIGYYTAVALGMKFHAVPVPPAS